MKAFVIALPQISKSMIVAERCIQSGKQYNINIELFEGIFRDSADDKRIEEGVLIEGGRIDETYSNSGAVIGCFMSHFMLWKKCIELDEPIIHLEHDAVINQPIPNIDYDYCVQIGKPSYGRYNQPNKAGLYPLFSKRHFAGTHAYISTPSSATDFINYAKTKGMSAADCYISKDKFPKLAEIYPWPVHVEETFSTVQKQKGINTKHAYNNNKNYKLL